MGNPDWGRWQVIIGAIALVIALAGLIVTYESSASTSNNNDNNNNININNINNNKVSTETVKSTPSTSFITVSSSPTGASIYLDGKYEGEASQVLSNIEPGIHLITLKLAGYEDWSQDISVDANKTISISPILTPIEVSTDISTTNTATRVETPEEDNVTVVETPKEEDTANNEPTTNLKIDNLSHVTWSYSTSKSDPNVKLYEGETIVNVSVYVKGSNDVDVYTHPYYWRFVSDGEPYSPECSESTFQTDYRGISPGSRDMFYLTFIIQGEPKHAELIYYLPTKGMEMF